MEYKVNGLEQLLSETKEMKSQLEHQKVEWERELYSLRYDILVLRKYFNYLLFFFFNRLHTQRGAWTHNYEIKSHMLCQLSQPGTPWNTYFYAADV